MNFSSYLNQAWSDHASQPQQVADGFSMGASLISSPEQISQLAALVTHVLGEHLGQWESGETFLNSLKSNSFYAPGTEIEQGIVRSAATLRLAAGDVEVIKNFSASDKIRICAVAASALSDRNINQAQELFSQALMLAEAGLEKSDPAAKALAVTGNNLASALEDRVSRTPGEAQLMITAAHAARKYWELVGTWMDVQSAEYRLAMTYIAAGDSETAYRHAKQCVDLTAAEAGPPLYYFYAYEAIALAERSRGNFAGFTLAAGKAKTYFAQLTDEDKSTCEATLKKLVAN